MSTALEPTTAARADRIRPHLEQAAESLFAAGDELVKAKEELPHGQFGALLEELNMTPRTAQRFMSIAKNVVLRDATHVSHLPSAWGTLYELSRVPDEVLETAIDTGEVNGSTTRAEAVALRPPAEADADAEADLARLREIEGRMRSGLGEVRTGLETAGGIIRLRVVDELLRRVPEADEPDHEVGVVLLSMAIDILDGMPAAEESAGPLGPLGVLSAAIAGVLPLLWSGDGAAIVRALAGLTIKAAGVPDEFRCDVLLQVLDGRRVEEIHPTTRLVVDALLAGFAVEGQPA